MFIDDAYLEGMKDKYAQALWRYGIINELMEVDWSVGHIGDYSIRREQRERLYRSTVPV